MQQAVIINFWYGKESLDPLYGLEDELRELMDQENIGEYDGHEIAMDNSDGRLYFYGNSAELLFKTILPVIKKVDFLENAEAMLRFGPPEEGVKHITVALNELY